ncbi:Cu(I)/Ag(I) efflux system membrane protein CusA/SilA [Pontibacter ummariensis]|uniref:Cu(I)/Ag(I) efflux system membrane protein CusA/SilA n=1 Tax=Pontibacter ummariensis TaxID=1610492 RepID=A0A239LT96_9BACT|nr:efflux RND transporter permease subunit [Pontibacter ummariensis]PRY01414.1 Cu(I)/Ag(I) efflux system membrane protein CusA/SilA [Pontibacter ummariensis]SNT32864.1 Cu(I)/Ag(I) efflux system membrane protein CusA/SilA [Pontibacter ummariensis]
MLNRIIRFFLENKLVTALLTVAFVAWGISTAPFNWEGDLIPRDPVPVDAIPDIGENQQIVYTEWMGKSPQDIEDQITYPLTTSLLGVPGVKTVRSSSMFGVSSIYVIFEEDVEFYWSRSRILEKLNSLPAGTLPEGVQPALGPDATALGQVYWYTLEGRNPETGEPTGGWDPQELRSIQDFYVKYSLSAAEGVSEVASIGGYIKEYQVDIDPIAMKSHGVNVNQIMEAVQESNQDVGARTIEFNKAEYLVRGLGYIESIDDLEEAVVAVNNNTPIRLQDVARVQLGPATRRGGLDKGGAEATGGVVVARYGSNPLEVINNVKDQIEEIAPGLPSKVLPDGTVSKVTVVPFYDRTGLIYETLGTLEEALTLEILISIIVVVVLVLNLRASILISSLLPIGVLMTFIVMRYAGVDANIVALSGIAIAIGVMLDVGVIFTENIIRHLEMPQNQVRSKLEVIYEGATEIASAVMTALATTIISFIPVFAMTGQEGKLFGPLAFTKTFALVAALFIGIVIIPALAHALFSLQFGKSKTRRIWNFGLIALGILVLFYVPWAGVMLLALGINNLLEPYWPEDKKQYTNYINIGIVLAGVLYFLTREWLPLGAGQSYFTNLVFVAGIITLVLGILLSMVRYYQSILTWCLENKWKFLSIPIGIVLFGILAWQGFDKVFGFVATGAEKLGWNVRETGAWVAVSETFPGAGEEFMPPLNEGSFLLMPSTMPHTGVEENIETIRQLDMLVTAIPEVDVTVGKWGRAATALDPAPISMFENVVNYKSEYVRDEDGRRVAFEVNDEGQYVLRNGAVFDPETMDRTDLDVSLLVPDPDGEYFRQWRDHIQSPDDIWEEIVAVSNLPGMTSAPKLQPIATRLIMLSTGMRAPMGLKVYGPDLETIEEVGLQMEDILKEVPGVKDASVFADRVVGKPYMEFDINRQAIARYGLSIADVQRIINAAIGGMGMTTTVEGRERYAVRVRYAREFRDNPEDVKGLLVPTPTGAQVPLGQLAEINYVQGPQNIKSEDTYLLGYVIFDKEEGFAEVEVVENAQEVIREKIASGKFEVPAGVSYKFAGNYENQLRASKTLSIVIPISLLAIFLLLYFQFGEVQPTLMAFSGVFVAFSGGFILLWLYNQPWFLDFTLFGENMRDVFQIRPINLSVAVWVGFIALFGVATDDGVLMGTYLKQVFAREDTTDRDSIRKAVVMAGSQRVRPAVMTTATTIIALLPVLTSTGKGSDIMIPMAIPTFGGMFIQSITMFVVPVLYSMWQERKWAGKPKAESIAS